VFVLIWSTGFIVARYGMPHSPPLTFLSIRYALSIAAFAIWALFARPPWPAERATWWHLAVAGVLLHAAYLGGVWAAVKLGISAGMVALIVGLQPVLTALWLAMLGSQHRATGRQWAGLLLGLCGVALVVWRKMHAGEVSAASFGLALFSLAAITVGTLYQKRFVPAIDVRSGNMIQLAAALVVSLPFALAESEPVRWDPEMIGAMAWSVLVLTLGGSSLLLLLIQRGAATQVTSLMYLVPPTTALMAWLLFRESLSLLVWAGLALTAVGVWLVMKAPPRPIDVSAPT